MNLRNQNWQKEVSEIFIKNGHELKMVETLMQRARRLIGGEDT